MRRFFYPVLLLWVLTTVWLAVNLWPRELEPELWPDTPLPPATGLSTFDLLENRNTEREAIRRASVSEDWPDAFDRSFRLFLADRVWLESTSSLVDQSAASLSLRKDFELLEELYKSKPPDDPDPVWDDLKAWDPAKIDPQKALAAEYRFNLAAVDSILEKTAGAQRLFFNHALTRRQLNDYFRAYDAYLKNPVGEPPSLKRGFFWWFVNPGGQSLVHLVAADYASAFRNLEENRGEIVKIRKRLLHH